MMRVIVFFISMSIGFSFFQTEIQSEEILIQNKDIALPGTLSRTKTSTNLVIWIHGSGDVDRNGNQKSANIKANYIKQIRDSLNKKDIAFFSYDKRTANPTNKGLLQGTLLDDFVADAKVVIAYFKKRKQFQNITLIGHSQGSLIAMLASEGIDKYVSLAGPSEKIDKTIVKQLTAQNAELAKLAEAHFKELSETGNIKEVNPFLKSVFAKPNLPFLKNWMQYDPLKEIEKLEIALLIINGDKDLQVKPTDAQALGKANEAAKLVIIKNMNHVLKNINKDSHNMASYFSPDYKISEELVKTLTEFIKS
jgi:pimeloyl-ACP methyl ester carboxylesterase